MEMEDGAVPSLVFPGNSHAPHRNMRRDRFKFRRLTKEELSGLPPGLQAGYNQELKMHRKQVRKKALKWTLIGVLAAIGVLVAVVVSMLFPMYKEAKESIPLILEDMDEDTFRRTGDTKIYDSEGTLIGQLGNERYEYVSIDNISDYILDGYVASEDADFYRHHGVDLKATMRAVLSLIKNRGEITQGGSTITQQVVKNNLLSQEQTFQRKITEMLLAIEVEKVYSKEQILEFYCNSNYYGNNCYGVEGAAQYYFGKSAADVTLAEAAILVGTSNSPNNYNPVASYDNATAKKEQVLGSMLEEGCITQEEYDAAVAENPQVVQKTENADADSYQISYAIHCTALELMAADGFEFQYTFSSQEEYEEYAETYSEQYNTAVSQVRGGGYTIYTSFVQDIQDRLQQAVDDGLSGFTDTQDDGRYSMQGAAVCIDNETQMVVAIVGGRGTEDSYNRGYQAVRQPGSCIKPLLDYGPAINEGVAVPATVYTDERVEYDGYSPENSNGKYRGNMTLREALARSINTVALQLYHDTGISTGLSYLDKMEFSTLCYTDSTVWSTSIGGFTEGVTVADMAKGYATLANQGAYSDNTCLLSVVDSGGDIVYEKTDEETEVFSESTAFILTDMLEGVFHESYGTAHDYENSSQVYAGKTGTTNDNKDAWFCGYSQYYTTAVWCGCDIPQSASGLYGSSYPAVIWSDFMDSLHEGLEKAEFEVPDTVVLADSRGNTKDIDYDTDIYDSRPSGYDYMSAEYAEQMLDELQENYRNSLRETIKFLLESFETMDVTSSSDEESVESAYENLISSINELDDGTEKDSYRSRADSRYQLLMSELENLEEEEEESRLSGASTSAVAEVNSYIQQLNQLSYYTEETETLIEEAEDALGDVYGTDSYADLSFRLEAAISYARSLPRRD